MSRPRRFGAGRRGRCQRRGRQRRVLAQDRLLELAQAGAWLEADLVELPARPLICGERIGLTAGRVEREHELAAQALAQRFLVDQPLELRDELRRTAELEIDVDALLDSAEAQLVEPRPLGGRPRKADALERDAAPERQRLAVRSPGRLEVPARKLLPGRVDLRTEELRVDVGEAEAEQVAIGCLERGRTFAVAAQQPPQPADMDVQALPRRRGWLVATELVDQQLGRDGAIGGECEPDEKRLEQLARHGTGLPGDPKREGAENASSTLAPQPFARDIGPS